LDGTCSSKRSGLKILAIREIERLRILDSLTLCAAQSRLFRRSGPAW